MTTSNWTSGYDLIRACLDAREKYGKHESEEDEVILITEAETFDLVAAHRHVAALQTQMFEELEYRMRHSQPLPDADEDDLAYLERVTNVEAEV